MRVWKFTFDVNDTVHIQMPEGAKILHVGTTVEGLRILVWALVNPKAPMEDRVFFVRGTDHEVEETLKHIGSCRADGPGQLVWHVFV
jgi:hypothetical protein